MTTDRTLPADMLARTADALIRLHPAPVDPADRPRWLERARTVLDTALGDHPEEETQDPDARPPMADTHPSHEFWLGQGPQYDDLPGRITGWDRDLSVMRDDEEPGYPTWTLTAGKHDLGDVVFVLDPADLLRLTLHLSAEAARYYGIADPWQQSPARHLWEIRSSTPPSATTRPEEVFK